jgi:hypothetical protein
MPAASSGIEAFAMAALFLALVSRGFRLAVARRARLPLPALILKEPPVSGGVSFLSWTIFFFLAQILLLMTLIRLAFIEWLASGFSRFFDRGVNLETSLA